MKEAQAVILGILVTEKGTRLTSDENKYQFRVAKAANKLEIKRAVEGQFGVHVTDVNTMVRAGKQKRGRTAKAGRAPDWKRAIVSLKAGESIQLA